MSSKGSKESPYADRDVVWVKLGRNLWWPGEVCGESRLPDGLLKSLKTKPLVIVRFFEEDKFEYIKNFSNICKYDDPKKNEFIQKGLDSFRADKKHMDKFPIDVTTAENLTNGDPNIITREDFLPQNKKPTGSCWANLFQNKTTTQKTPQSGRAGKSTPLKPSTTARIGILKKPVDHEVRILTQPAATPSTLHNSFQKEPDEKLYKCHLCTFSSKRVNVVMLHSKTHTNESTVPLKKSVTSTKSTTHSNLKSPILKKPIQNTILKVRKINDSDSESNKCTSSVSKKKITKRKTRSKNQKKLTTKTSKISNSPLKILEESEIIEESVNEKLPLPQTQIEKEIKQNVSIQNRKTTNHTVTKDEILADWSDDDDDDADDDDDEFDKEIKEIPKVLCQNDEIIKTLDNNATIKNLIEISPGSSSITKYRNIPKKDRERDFIFNVLNPDDESNQNQKSPKKGNDNNNVIESNGTETINDTIVTEDTKNLKRTYSNLKFESKSESENEILNIKSPKLDETLINDENLPKKSSEIFEFQDEDDIELDKSPPKRQRQRKNILASVDSIEDDKQRDDILDTEMKSEIDNFLISTSLPKLPEIPKFLRVSSNDENYIDDKIKDETKDRTLPPKERGKRIFKSRNRSKILKLNTDYEIDTVRKDIMESSYESVNETDTGTPNESDLTEAKTSIIISPKREIIHSVNDNIIETEIIESIDHTLICELPKNDLNIAESLVNLSESIAFQEKLNKTDNIESNIEVNTTHLPRKKHIQAAFKAEEEKNQLTEIIQLTKPVMPIVTIAPPSLSPKQKFVLKIKEEQALEKALLESRLSKKRKSINEDELHAMSISKKIDSDETIIEKHEERLKENDECLKLEPVLARIETNPVVLEDKSRLENVPKDFQGDVQIKLIPTKKSRRDKKKLQSKVRKITQNDDLTNVSEKQDPVILDADIKTITPTIDIINQNIDCVKSTEKKEILEPDNLNDSIESAKMQSISSGPGNQIVITSKGQVITTNVSTSLSVSLSTTNTVDSTNHSILAMSSKELTPQIKSKIQVQSQIIYSEPITTTRVTTTVEEEEESLLPDAITAITIEQKNSVKVKKLRSEKQKLIKMSPQKLAEMTKLGFIKENAQGKVLTSSGYKKIQEQLSHEKRLNQTREKSKTPPASTNKKKTVNESTDIVSTTKTTIVSPTTTDVTENYFACAAETFGGPPNSFYLCRIGENNTYIPIDNRALYLDAFNQLVEEAPEVTSPTAIEPSASTEPQEQITALAINPGDSVITDLNQLQDGSHTFIINTGDGQQIILDQQSLLSFAAGEMPNLITADGQQIVLQGSPQEILTALVNQQEIGTESHVIIPDVVESHQTCNHDILAVALEGTDVYPANESLISDVLLQNPTHTEIVCNQTVPTAAVLSKPPIMSTLVVPTTKKSHTDVTIDTNLNIEDSLAAIGVTTTNIPSSLELPITVTNPAIASKTSPLSLNTIYTPPISTIGPLSSINSSISPSLGYDLFDTSSSSSSTAASSKLIHLQENSIVIDQDHDILNRVEELNVEGVVLNSPEMDITPSTPSQQQENESDSNNSDEIPMQPSNFINVYKNDGDNVNDNDNVKKELNHLNNDNGDER